MKKHQNLGGECYFGIHDFKQPICLNRCFKFQNYTSALSTSIGVSLVETSTF